MDYASSLVSMARRAWPRLRPLSRAAKRAARPDPIPCAAEPLEGRILFALAGHPGFSANLSSSAALARQQLIADPGTPVPGAGADVPVAGSSSVRYDAALVSLVGITPGPGYKLDLSRSVIELKGSPPPHPYPATTKPPKPTGTFLVPLSKFLGESRPAGTETGFVQVRFSLVGSAGQMHPPSGFKVVDESGVPGVDTHALTFKLRQASGGETRATTAGGTGSGGSGGGIPTGPQPTYTIFAAPAGTRSGNAADFLTDRNGRTFGPGEISPATVSFKGFGPAARLVPDPADSRKQALSVLGTQGPDTIRFEKVGGGLRVRINGTAFGPFNGFGRVIADGVGGNDDIQMNAQGSYEVAFFGGMGNDTLVGGNGPSLLVGGEGNDTLIGGGNGSDVLVGGGGRDTLRGNNADDLLVSGRTAFDGGATADVRSLTGILDEWTRGGSYETRIAHLTGRQGGGRNGGALFSTTGLGRTVFDDGDPDTLLGGNGRDWFLTGPEDTTDLAKSEVRTAL